MPPPPDSAEWSAEVALLRARAANATRHVQEASNQAHRRVGASVTALMSWLHLFWSSCQALAVRLGALLATVGRWLQRASSFASGLWQGTAIAAEQAADTAWAQLARFGRNHAAYWARAALLPSALLDDASGQHTSGHATSALAGRVLPASWRKALLDATAHHAAATTASKQGQPWDHLGLLQWRLPGDHGSASRSFSLGDEPPYTTADLVTALLLALCVLAPCGCCLARCCGGGRSGRCSRCCCPTTSAVMAKQMRRRAPHRACSYLWYYWCGDRCSCCFELNRLAYVILEESHDNPTTPHGDRHTRRTPPSSYSARQRFARYSRTQQHSASKHGDADLMAPPRKPPVPVTPNKRKSAPPPAPLPPPGSVAAAAESALREASALAGDGMLPSFTSTLGGIDMGLARLALKPRVPTRSLLAEFFASSTSTAASALYANVGSPSVQQKLKDSSRAAARRASCTSPSAASAAAATATARSLAASPKRLSFEAGRLAMLNTTRGGVRAAAVLEEVQAPPHTPDTSSRAPTAAGAACACAAVAWPASTRRAEGHAALQSALARMRRLLESSLSRVRDLLHQTDRDGDGMLSPDELRRAFSSLGMPPTDAALAVDACFDALDHDRSGLIDYAELYEAIRRGPTDPSALAPTLAANDAVSVAGAACSAAGSGDAIEHKNSGTAELRPEQPPTCDHAEPLGDRSQIRQQPTTPLVPRNVVDVAQGELHDDDSACDSGEIGLGAAQGHGVKQYKHRTRRHVAKPAAMASPGGCACHHQLQHDLGRGAQAMVAPVSARYSSREVVAPGNTIMSKAVWSLHNSGGRHPAAPAPSSGGRATSARRMFSEFGALPRMLLQPSTRALSADERGGARSSGERLPPNDIDAPAWSEASIATSGQVVAATSAGRPSGQRAAGNEHEPPPEPTRDAMDGHSSRAAPHQGGPASGADGRQQQCPPSSAGSSTRISRVVFAPAPAREELAAEVCRSPIN